MSAARAERRRAERARAEHPREPKPRDGKYGHPVGKWRRGNPRYGWTWYRGGFPAIRRGVRP